MPDCLHCRLWDAVADAAGGNRIAAGTMFRALAEMIADLLARMSEDAASARFLELQILAVAMERTKRRQLGTAGQDMAGTVQGVCGHG